MRIPFRIGERRGAEALVCGALCLALLATGSAQELRSAALAKELASRFVAAMLFPEVQLLMVTARHSSPE